MVVGKDLHTHRVKVNIIQLSAGITHGRVLNGELYAQRFQQLIFQKL